MASNLLGSDHPVGRASLSAFASGLEKVPFECCRHEMATDLKCILRRLSCYYTASSDLLLRFCAGSSFIELMFHSIKKKNRKERRVTDRA